MKTPAQDPSQLTFSVFCPPIITANGDGFTVKPGRPVVKLSAAQVAAHFTVDRETVYRWRQEGLIPESLVHRAGLRKLSFDAAVIPHLEARFKASHE
ncbi:MAG TPA: hypothetical protein VG167_01040 [Verrucomicrobiae bacterium]|nr:hypothetical protein [Verrucomicrobiae bacterium]